MDQQRVIQVLQELVRIPSVNPAFPGGGGEAGAAAYVAVFFEQLGLSYEKQPVEKERDNVVALLPGSRPSRLLLEAHMDTVQTDGMTIEPFGGEFRDGRVWGRGACDTKASLAAMLVAVETVTRSGLIPPVTVELAAVVDEEATYKGVSALAQRIAAEEEIYVGAVVGEPTELQLIAAHKGCLRFHIEVYGLAGHSSEPGSAVNAIEQTRIVLDWLEEVALKAYPLLHHPLTGPPTHCVTRIQGGVAHNTVPDLCRITLDRRTVPGEEPLEVYAGFKAGLQKLQAEHKGLSLAVSAPFIVDCAMDTPPDADIVCGLLAAANSHGRKAEVRGAAYCSDASKLARAGVPSVVFGPGSIRQAHTRDEWVEVEQVVQAADIFLRLILGLEPDGQAVPK
ncbi:acetylornithine deacetylase [Paenibacillus yonginensis]|uniref:Probable succinyl-diaminopimelate desuccinylase n=1 Tax=Paenibacillus yonginensis TaxID=1462996 RepID=A0A1B1N6F7_9BACL|nr:acetylornithine deacetylase [Paenibacillus yonginensis]